MKVKVSNNMYRMSRQQYEKLLNIASEQIPFGIFAIEKKGYAELRADKTDSMTQLKKMIRGFKEQGFKVRYNGK